MKFIDLHCDTLMNALNEGVSDVYLLPNAMLDVKRLKEYGAWAEFFAIFFPPGTNGSFERDGKTYTDIEYFNLLYNCYKNTLTHHGDFFAEAGNAADLEKNLSDGKVSGILTFEDGRIIDGSFDNMKKYYDMGIRLITLTWNGENCFGYPNSSDAQLMNLGLKDFGKEAIEYMNELGIIIDVSHLSDGGFWDVASISKKPFLASHSNCRSLSPHRRNLTDEMIKTLAKKGGVSGINFAPGFLQADITSRDSTLDLIALHLHKMIELGGEDFPALGSDFDGITGNFEISGVEKMHMIFDRLSSDGLSDRVIEKIAWGNVHRVIKETL